MKSNSAFEDWTYIVGVVVTDKSNMASYFPEAENLNDSNADMCSDVAGPLSSGSDDLTLDLALDPLILLGFEPDFNSHTAFRGMLHHYA